MAPRAELLDYETGNAVFAWLVVVVLLLAAVGHVRAGRLLWAGLSLVAAAVAVVPPVVSRRPTEMVAWEVLAVAAVPVVARAVGVLVGPASSVAIAGLALVVAVELDAFTDVEMSPEFATVWVVVVTMAVAGFWTAAAYGSDVYLGTSLLGSRTELMWDIVAATVVGAVVGLLFEFYVRRRSPGHDRARGPSRDAG